MTLQEIARALGGEVQGHQVRAPGPGHSPKDRSLVVKLSSTAPDGFVVYSHAGDNPLECKDYIRERSGLAPFKPRGARRARRAAVPTTAAHHGDHGETAEARVKAALRIWREAEPLRSPASSRRNTHPLGWRYFTERRGLHIGLLDDLFHALRWHEGVGAVVALMTDPLTNKPTGVHRTFLAKDATKIERKMLGRQGVIRLSSDEEVTLGLGLTEGVEDGLAVLLSGWSPVWAATSASAIERFPVLGGIDRLTVHADYDNAGITAAQACVDRWIAAGREAAISFPKEFG